MKIDFNDNWNYKNGDVWEKVRLPHDAMIDGVRSADAAGGAACAYFGGGVYVYERSVAVPEEWRGKTAWLEFGGVYRNPKVYINGKLAGEWAYGYSEFCVPLDDFLEYGKENSVRVVADNSKLPNSRWYTGGGIYRPVSLIVKNKVHIMRRGVTVQTVSVAPAKIRVVTKATGGEVRLEVCDGETVVALAQGADVQIEIPDAKLWSAETPDLYTLRVRLFESGELTDEETVRFGIRTLSWSANGFFVNGKSVKLRGGCVHHDNGILGACAYDEAEERKVRILKKAGYNAVRFSHNPCSEAFASACDIYGLYLIDEFSDMWYSRKKKYDYALDFPKWYKKDLAAMVGKDKNHPSVIMYSLGNEVSEPHETKGVRLIREMADHVRSMDDSRAVTAGINFFIILNAARGKGVYSEEKVQAGNAVDPPVREKPTSSTLFNMIATHAGPSMNRMGNGGAADRLVSPCMDALDVCGYNYASGRYSEDIQKHPDRIFYGSETFPQDIYRNWQQVKKYDRLVGDFMWTAWDYLGEAGMGGWSYEPQYGMAFEKPYPWIIADAGAVDIIGNIGAEAKYASVVWGREKEPYICVRPVNKPRKKLVKSVWRGTNALASWSWRGCEGKPAEVEVYTDAYAVTLYLNGKKIGRKKVKECRACFKTKYVAGELKAVAADRHGNLLSENVLRSARGHRISVTCEKEGGKPGEILFFDVTLADRNGNIESNADCRLKAFVKNGDILAFDSARQKTEERYSAPSCNTYYGRALLVVRAKEKGELQISVTDEDHGKAEKTVCIGEE